MTAQPTLPGFCWRCLGRGVITVAATAITPDGDRYSHRGPDALPGLPAGIEAGRRRPLGGPGRPQPATGIGRRRR